MPPEQEAPTQTSSTAQPSSDLPGAGADLDPAIFLKPIPPDQLSFLAQFAGSRSGDAWHDKQLRKLLKQIIPDCMYHYGKDMPLDQALDVVLDGSTDPVLVRDSRYILISGSRGPYLGGRGFVWIDTQLGIGLGGFYFHPTNGEPTPSFSVFSRQVKEKAIGMSQLPLAFAEDLSLWAQAKSVAPISTRYFLTGSNKRILLEHDEDYCVPADGSSGPPADECRQMNADAADIDMTAAYYLKQVNYATNATAWMISNPDQVAWIGMRNSRCGLLLDCRVAMTHVEIHRITGRPAPPPHPAPRPMGRR